MLRVFYEANLSVPRRVARQGASQIDTSRAHYVKDRSIDVSIYDPSTISTLSHYAYETKQNSGQLIHSGWPVPIGILIHVSMNRRT